ncbi:MAG: cold-shock protein [Gammaproteobacteria bacterium]|nr:cold-shock protein [Gammaproteobacteria bacterium]
MRRTLFIYSFIISLIAALALPFILDEVVRGSHIVDTQFELVAGVAFAMFWIATLATGVKFIASGVEDDAQWDEMDDDPNRESGTVKWFNVTKGFGFVTRDQGDDVFVHFRSIRGKGHRSLLEGQRVRFSVTESDKGLQAEDVSIVG